MVRVDKKAGKSRWRKVVKIAVIVLVLSFAALQFVRPNFTNPPVVESETVAASTSVPHDVQSILARSCNDCHSNTSKFPWYSQVSPFSWFLADHIEDGRHDLNFDSWNTYNREKKMHKLDEICEQVEKGFMPLGEYLWLHREAVMTEADKTILCDWAKVEGERLLKSQ